jgi:hypothetical protein
MKVFLEQNGGRAVAGDANSGEAPAALDRARTAGSGARAPCPDPLVRSADSLWSYT